MRTCPLNELGEQSLRENRKSEGISHFLMKPFVMAKLARAIRKVLSDKK